MWIAAVELDIPLCSVKCQELPLHRDKAVEGVLLPAGTERRQAATAWLHGDATAPKNEQTAWKEAWKFI